MRRIYCDTPNCKEDITDSDRYIVEVSKFTPDKLIPAMPSRELCANCKEELRRMIDRLAVEA